MPAVAITIRVIQYGGWDQDSQAGACFVSPLSMKNLPRNFIIYLQNKELRSFFSTLESILIGCSKNQTRTPEKRKTITAEIKSGVRSKGFDR